MTKYFIPVCLYPHTSYRTKAGVQALYDKYQLDKSDVIFVVADRLLGLDRLVTGRYWSKSSVFEKARRDAKPVYRLFEKFDRPFVKKNSRRVFYWDEICEDQKYIENARRIERLVTQQNSIRREVQKFVDSRVNRFGIGVNRQFEFNCEWEYVLSEIFMSVYCTEILGYNTEVWERDDPNREFDPIGVLYRDHIQYLEDNVIRRKSERRLSFLFE